MILFICTGNTCRSPLAAAMARARGWDAQSAGLSAIDGQNASLNAQRAAKRRGLDLSAHRARRVTGAILEQAERIYTMTEEQLDVLCARFPSYAKRADFLWPPVPDPFGGGESDYEDCADTLSVALDGIAGEVGP